MTDTRELVRRWLRTRASLSDPPLLLEGSREEALRLFASFRQPGGAARKAGAAASAPASGAPRGTARAPTAPPARKAAPPSADPAAVALAPQEVARLAREAGPEEIVALPDLASVAAVAGVCTRCELHATRTHVVFADGDPAARLMCVGEAPGAVEDETGLPFVGPAGKLLDRLLLSVGLRRESVYICNVLKCRPPRNRNPEPEEIERCSPFLLRQVELVRPEVIVAFGAFAARTLVGSRESIGRLRGRVHAYGGVPLVVTYHPAALLRNPGWTRPTWEDLQLARRVLDGEGVSGAVEQELGI